ncbi:hypothetical protein T05_3609 [Trichinella murrelli]|uniref:Uncharacterized protein n=1 Tax=Trichinella murrelli TaxID=144512 RepID=A0A0V0TL92_9BILA|nr:hypothetical protein T05_3609 [Trichinella murrelli]
MSQHCSKHRLSTYVDSYLSFTNGEEKHHQNTVHKNHFLNKYIPDLSDFISKVHICLNVVLHLLNFVNIPLFDALKTEDTLTKEMDSVRNKGRSRFLTPHSGRYEDLWRRLYL